MENVKRSSKSSPCFTIIFCFTHGKIGEEIAEIVHFNFKGSDDNGHTLLKVLSFNWLINIMVKLDLRWNYAIYFDT